MPRRDGPPDRRPAAVAWRFARAPAPCYELLPRVGTSPAQGSKDCVVAEAILLVEDDPDIARSLSKALESSGYRVTAVDTGAEARSIIEHVRPDLILRDLMLP